MAEVAEDNDEDNFRVSMIDRLEHLQIQQEEIQINCNYTKRTPGVDIKVSPHGSLNVTTPRSNGPLNWSRTTGFHQPPHFDEKLHPPPYGGRRGGFGKRGMPRHFEEVPRPQARHGEPLYDDHEHVPFVAICGRDQGDQTLDRMKWKLLSFKGENDPNIFLDWERQVENMFMLKNCNESLKAKLVMAVFSSYALHWWERVVNQRVRSGRSPVES
ncbi:hypothetical protein M9H77_03111 [Catharanthus roseus]|uniref:Uncharacterized protein n=1 Tax=Catharanthus roseus TaxID=4058 RepID=A0ACC0CAT0_CATRO|nr:hypothetical protein M9H77_03111 [Catharanthus roseus]